MNICDKKGEGGENVKWKMQDTEGVVSITSLALTCLTEKVS